MLMTFPHGIFSIWRIRFPKKNIITYLTCTHFQNEIFEIYILGEIMYMWFSSESRTKPQKCLYINEVEKKAFTRWKYSSKFYWFFFKLRIQLKFPFFCRKLILKCIQYLDFIIFFCFYPNIDAFSIIFSLFMCACSVVTTWKCRDVHENRRKQVWIEILIAELSSLCRVLPALTVHFHCDLWTVYAQQLLLK